MMFRRAPRLAAAATGIFLGQTSHTRGIRAELADAERRLKTLERCLGNHHVIGTTSTVLPSVPAELAGNVAAAPLDQTVTREIYLRADEQVAQHFWHFMMGEFLPVVATIVEEIDSTNIDNSISTWNPAVQADTGRAEKAVRLVVHLCKSGVGQMTVPLNSFYEELCHSGDLRIIISDQMAEGKEAQYIQLQRWDFDFGGNDWWDEGGNKIDVANTGTNAARLLRAAAWLREWAWDADADADADGDADGRAAVLVQMRTDTPALTRFYQAHARGPGKGGSKVYGSAKRQVTNLDAIAADIRNTFHERTATPATKFNSDCAAISNASAADVLSVSDDASTLRQQIRRYSRGPFDSTGDEGTRDEGTGEGTSARQRTNTRDEKEVLGLVWGHGAGMIHSLWVPPECRLVEVSCATFASTDQSVVLPLHPPTNQLCYLCIH
jgi:hypothetical protein